MLASAQIHPCDERRERTGEQGEGGGRGRGGEEEEKGKEEEEEEERATDVSGDVQRSQRTSGSLHAAAHTNHPGWLHKYLAPIFSLIIPSCFITTTIVENVPLQRAVEHSRLNRLFSCCRSAQNVGLPFETFIRAFHYKFSPTHMRCTINNPQIFFGPNVGNISESRPPGCAVSFILYA